MTSAKAKTPRDSAVETRYVVMPHQANPNGTAFGGAIMSWIDMVAGMAAQRHCGSDVVTAEIDSLSFKLPVHIGEHVVLKATVNYVGRTSMEVGVKVLREDLHTGEQVVATTAYLTLVALGKDKKPTPAPPLAPETAEEQRRYDNARQRVGLRKQRAWALREGESE
jgi:acyl-CoA hydrolase